MVAMFFSFDFGCGILSILMLFVKWGGDGGFGFKWTKSVECDKSYLSAVPKHKKEVPQ